MQESVLAQRSNDTTESTKESNDDDGFYEKMQKYQQIIEDIKESGEDDTAEFLEEAKNWLEIYRKNEDLLRTRIEDMGARIIHISQALDDARITNENTTYNLRSSTEENEELKRELDSAHVREQDYQELIDSLRSQTGLLESEVDKVKKEQDNLATELGISGRTKEVFFRERDTLKKENASLKSELGTAMVERDDLVKDLQEAKTSLTSTQNQLEELKLLNSEVTREKGYVSKEAAMQRSLVHQLKKNLILLKTHHDGLRNKLEDANKDTMDQKAQLFTSQRVNRELRTTINNEQREISALNTRVYDLVKMNQDMKETIKNRDREALNLKKQISQVENRERKTMASLKVIKEKEEKMIRENKQLDQQRRSTASEIQGVKSQRLNTEAAHAKLERELALVSTHLLKTTNLAAEYLRKLDVEMKVKTADDQEKDKLKQELHKNYMMNLNVLSEKDRCRSENTQLAHKLEEELLYIKHMEQNMACLKKEIEELKMGIRKQSSLYDDIKGERNVIARSLSESQDMAEELKRHNKILSKQLDQLKEQMTAKEANLLKAERMNRRKMNEGVKLKWQLAKCRNQSKACKDSAFHLEKELTDSLKVLEKAEKERNTVTKSLAKVKNDKAVILTQLDRKTAELSCFQDSVNFMGITLKKGDRQYNQRLEDIKLLRLEVLKLRREKQIVVKALENSADLRKEVYHVYTDLNRERTKCAALEQEIQTPVNFHRWRLLLGTDPEKKDLIAKMNCLQKKLVNCREQLVDRDFEIDSLKCAQQELRRSAERMPGIEVYQTIAELRTELNKKDEELKTLAALQSASDFELQKLRLMEKMNSEQLCQFKKQYYDLKLRKDKKKMQCNSDEIKVTDCNVKPAEEPPKKKRLNDPSLNIPSIAVSQIPCAT